MLSKFLQGGRTMIVNHNLSAINSHRALKFNEWDVTKNMEKLSSGYRINRAGDDASGLAVSEKMRSQIRCLRQAERNSEDAISFPHLLAARLGSLPNHKSSVND